MSLGITATHVMKSIGTPPVSILKDISLEIASGEFVALTGRSGSGKSTLLYLLSSLDLTTGGSIKIDDCEIAWMESEALHRFRNQKMGFIFQFNYLLAELTLLENVLMPTLKFKQREQFHPHALELLEQFSLKDKMNQFPRELSGGEQQRVAIARALVMKSSYLFADEPTGSLDTANGALVLEIIRGENRAGTTVVMVTHDPGFAAQAQRIIELSDGQIVRRS